MAIPTCLGIVPDPLLLLPSQLLDLASLIPKQSLNLIQGHLGSQQMDFSFRSLRRLLLWLLLLLLLLHWLLRRSRHDSLSRSLTTSSLLALWN